MVETVRETLLRRAYLFDDPAAYSAGVEDTLATLRDEDLLAHDDGGTDRRVAIS